MPILDLQRSMRRLGRIRMGSQVPTQSGKLRPNKLETWRMTSTSQELLAAAAELYGGRVAEWNGAPSGRQWELFTEADTLDVVIPPGEMAFSQWYELWSEGGCQRRCDGNVEQLSGEPCVCPADRDERRQLANKGDACKPTSRLFVIQPRLPDVGMWHFESHGFYAAVELAGSIEVLRQASAVAGLIPARLRIEQRSVKRDGKTNNFAVPVIELPTLTTHALMTGEVQGDRGFAHPELPAAAAPAIEAPPPQPESTPAPATRVRKQAKPAQAAPVKDAAPARAPGDGKTFVRAIRMKAERVGIDEETLLAICMEVCGKPVDEIVEPYPANGVLAAIDERVKQRRAS